MSVSAPRYESSRRPIRLWPGIAIAVLVIILRFVAPRIHPDAAIAGVLGTVGGLLAVIVWWLFFSRAPWADRLLAVAAMAVGIAATVPLLHVSLARGMMGMFFILFAVPLTLALGFVAWAVLARRLPDVPRRATMIASIVLACLVWTLFRSDGILRGGPQLAWRWTPTAEQRLLAQTADAPAPVPPAAQQPAADSLPPAPATTWTSPVSAPAGASALGSAPLSSDRAVGRPGEGANAPSAPAPESDPTAARAEWPATSEPTIARVEWPATSEPTIARVEWSGFRGGARDSVIRGLTIATDWSRTPPGEIWRKPIGPGWSSFAVQGNLIYTQEQRGEQEMVSAYRFDTGEPVWRHSDPVRFWESEGGAGPRGTPAVGHGRVYAMGATGIVNALDAATGRVVWTRNAEADTGATRPDWGFASSPLVVADLVVVAASGRLVGYDAATGAPRWLGPEGGAGYSSPHLATIEGQAQIVLLRGSRTVAVSPADGSLLWEHTWSPGVSIVQPAQLPDGDLLLTVGDAMGGLGVRRVGVTRDPSGGWIAQERWTSRGLKPYFNDYVVHDGHAYGFDGSIMSCIDLADGERKWKGGRYGQGQVVLLADQGLLLVTAEEGDLALVTASPDKHTELARIPGIEGKTWNHPVVVGDVLLVRNGEEMAAFRLPRAAR
jgi:outer membrane protein assembly factor BamB